MHDYSEHLSEADMTKRPVKRKKVTTKLPARVRKGTGITRIDREEAKQKKLLAKLKREAKQLNLLGKAKAEAAVLTEAKLPARVRKSTGVAKFIPQSVPAAMAALDRMLVDLRKAKTYRDIEKIIDAADAIKVIFKRVDDVRLRAGRNIVLGSHLIGLELLKAPKSSGGRPKKTGNTELPVSKATLEELTGYKMKGHRLKKLAEIDPDKDQVKITKFLESLIEERAENISVGATIKAYAGLQSQKRREKSRNAKPLPNGAKLSIGDCREVLADVKDNSVDLILTDPPWADEAKPLYEWLAEFSARVLKPGGSLICFTGQSNVIRNGKIFDEHKQLRYWWLMSSMRTQAQRIAGKFVMAEFVPVLWYVKEKRRNKILVPDVLRPPKPEKEDHAWGQGEGGVTHLIESLTDPGDLIVDPFAGTATWGDIAASMGRRWIGADIEKGGTTTAFVEQVDEIAEAAE
jgi:adenine-specific DNA-methyltransferase